MNIVALIYKDTQTIHYKKHILVDIPNGNSNEPRDPNIPKYANIQYENIYS